jgi:hypothetical protein
VGEFDVRVVIVVAVLAAFAGPALAGRPYQAPALMAAETLEPPADLRADAIALLKAVRAEDLDAVGRFIAPSVTVVNGFLDMAVPRRVKALGQWKNGRAALAELGQNTGGDWDLPPDVDIGAFLSNMELDFIEGALTDGQPWGTDPILPGTICTYGYHSYDPVAVKRVAAALKVDPASFVMVDEGASVRDKPGGKTIGTLSAGQLYAMDTDTDTTSEWMALHLPQGGVGYVAVGDDGLDKPYGDGLCFKKAGGAWKVVGQAATGL